ncbi:MAG TPA: SMP-30/gluconolactonase/LRE family protein [Bryobacteraceae bacterium]
MKFKSTVAISVFCSATSWCQTPAPANQKSGPGVQATQDPKEADVLKTCKTPPQGRGGQGKGKGKGGGAAPAAAGPRDYSVTAIAGVIAAGQKWKEVWQVDGNNADGIIATKDGGLLIAQNDNSNVVKLDKDGKTSVAYSGLNTSGSVAMNSKGSLFVVNRGVNESIEELAPVRKTFADKYNGDPIDCLGGGVLNDITADGKGGVYFTMGGLFHADPQGKITRYGENLGTNGIVLSADEKHLFVTNTTTLAEFDVQKDGSLTNQREFAKLEGGGDGSTFDSTNRLYVTVNRAAQAPGQAPIQGVQVIATDGTDLGLIPTPRGVISVAFSGPDRKTLYAVSRDNAQNKDWIIAIQMIAQGPKGRGK